MVRSISPYTLQFTWGGKRQGFLLRQEDDFGIGYADCHPWEELGDAPLTTQLKLLKQGLSTPLLEQVKKLAQIDAIARSQRKSLFADREIPKSHQLVTLDDLNPWDATHLKIKLRPNQVKAWMEVASKSSSKWRLDFNACLTATQAEQFLIETRSLHPMIDLIEDISAYDRKLWTSWQEHFNVCLASDFEGDEMHTNTIIHKPCSRALTRTADRIIVTSSLGHPVGQLMAAYIATTLAPKEVGGWLSHLVYEPTVFSEQLTIHDGRLRPPAGTGIGFDNLLKELPWTKL